MLYTEEEMCTYLPEMSDISQPYAFYKYCVNWKVDMLCNGHDNNGYIVQKVHFEPGISAIAPIDDYYEAWPVIEGKVVESYHNPDDTFMSDDGTIAHFLLDGSIGKKACTVYVTQVYWIDRSDKNSLLIDQWKSGETDGIFPAGKLKACLVSNAGAFDPPNLKGERKFMHITDCTTADNVVKSIRHCFKNVIEEKPQIAIEMISDLLSGTAFENLFDLFKSEIQ